MERCDTISLTKYTYFSAKRMIFRPVRNIKNRAVSISINDFTEPHPLPTPDPDYEEISLEEYLERLANGEIFEDPSGDEKELALYASTGWEQVSGKWKYKADGVYVVNAWKFHNTY